MPIWRHNFPGKFLAIMVILLLGLSCQAGPEEDFYYVIAADPQLFWKEQNNTNWCRTIDTVNKLKPDFMIVCGDLVSRMNSPKELKPVKDDLAVEGYKEGLARLDKGIGVYHVAGNHDVCATPTAETLSWYRDRFGDLWYSFVHKNSLFIVLESCILREPAGAPAVAREQMDWLKKLLKSTARKKYHHKTVYMHHPLFLNSPDEPGEYLNCPPELRKTLLDLFAKHKVSYVFSGHLHVNCFAKAGDIKLITTASSCHLHGKSNVMPGLRLVHVTPDRIFDDFFTYEQMPERIEDLRLKRNKSKPD